MSAVREWVRRLLGVFGRGRADADLRDELRLHADLARDHGRLVPGVAPAMDALRDQRGLPWVDDLRQDIRYALRMLSKSPGFTIVALVTLALGIGVNSAMFSLVNDLLLRPLYEHPANVFSVHSRASGPRTGLRGVSWPDYLDLRDGTTDIFAILAASFPRFAGLDAGDGTRRVLLSAVTASYFDLFGRPLALGRGFTAEEERLDAPVAIISYQLWERLGADPRVLDRPMRINGEAFTVIGVSARGFAGPSVPGPEAWLPLRPGVERDARNLDVLGRLRPGTAFEAAAPAVAAVGRRLEQAYPASNGGFTLELARPARLMFMPGPARGSVTATLGAILMIVPIIVLLVACLNLAGLLHARGHARRHELAIRSSLGGSRGRITRQLLAEGMLLAVAGGALGLLLSEWATQALLASIRPSVPLGLTLPEFRLDWRVLSGTLAFVLVAMLVSSASPAWIATRRDAVTDLKRRAGGEGRSPRAVGISNRMAIEQIALSVLLLASGGLFVTSAISTATADPGFPLDRSLLIEIDPGLVGYDEPQGRESHSAVLDRLRAVPGVEAVSIASGLPFSSMSDSRDVAPAAGSAPPVDSVFSLVGRDYARSLGLRMLAGRDFTDAELAPGTEPVAIVDDVLARRLWPGASALDRQIRFADARRAEAGRSMRVVGVVPAVKHSFGNARPFPHVYVPLGQGYESGMTLLVRLADDGAERTVRLAIPGIIRSVDARVPVLRVETWRDHLDASLDVWFYRAGAVAFSAFGAMALLLAVIGVYGVKSYLVSCRTREFGIRLAVGADARALRWQVVREGGWTTIAGIVIGTLLALGAGQLLQSVLYGVNGVEPAVLLTAPLLLLASSIVASYLPARRAAKVDPAVALRSE